MRRTAARVLIARVPLWAVLGACACAPAPENGAARAGADAGERVERAEDGDTVLLANGNEVRYLGIDTPERGEPYAGEARDENRTLVAGKLVGLRRAGPEDKDRYGRLLRAVYITEPPGEESGARVCVNVALVKSGLALIYVAENDAVEPWLLRDLLSAQEEAITARKKMWRDILDRERSDPLVASRWRIHRKDCKEIAQYRLRPVASLEKELRQGKSPCRSCAPLSAAFHKSR